MTSRVPPRGTTGEGGSAAGQPMLPGRDEGGPQDRDGHYRDRRPPAPGRSGALRGTGPGDDEDRQDGRDHGRRDAEERGIAAGADGDLPQGPAARPDHRDLGRPAHRDHPRGEQQHGQAGDRQAHVEQPEQRVHRLRGRDEQVERGQHARGGGQRGGDRLEGTGERRRLGADLVERVAQRLHLLAVERTHVQREHPLHPGIARAEVRLQLVGLVRPDHHPGCPVRASGRPLELEVGGEDAGVDAPERRRPGQPGPRFP